jgi:hypothetical protein
MLFIKRLFQAFLLLPVLFLIYVNWQLFYKPHCDKDINQDVVEQLHFLENQLKNNQAATQMQGYFPEGFVFLSVTYGLAWAEVLEKADRQSPILKKGLAEIRWALTALHSDEGQAIFKAPLPLRQGAFYKGWTTYLLGKYLELEPTDGWDNLFKTNCLEIKTAIENTPLPYLESYPDAAWPADNILCLASLSLHDKIYPPQYQPTIRAWLDKIQQHLDPKTGLLPHAFDLSLSHCFSEPRGSSQSLMLSLLPQIDSSFAVLQFEKFKNHFVIHRLSLPAIGEYPKGTTGEGDVDSGPVIWDVGAVASIMGIKAAAKNGDWTLHQNLRNSIEALGFPTQFGGQKRYLFGKLPMADGFIAWSNAQACDCKEGSNWHFSFLLGSILVMAFFVWWAYKL